MVLAKSGCPSTTVAWPTHTGHFRLYVSCAAGLGSIPERFWNSSTRWLLGDAPTRFESATNSVSAA